MKRHITSLYYILAGILCWIIPLQAYSFFNEDFRILTIQNGLADNKVNCIFRDADGFMWFGTDFGFSIYNGSSFKNFTITDSNNHIESIHQLTPQCIGILTEEELYAFNLEQEEFIPIENIEPHTRISGIHSTNDNTCWLLTDKALFHGRLHIQKTAEGKIKSLRFETFKRKKLQDITTGSVTCYSFYPELSSLYLTDNKAHLIRYNLQTDRIDKQISIPELPGSVTQLFKQGKYLWISTISKGVIRYNEQAEQLEHFTYDTPNPDLHISHTDIYAIVPIGNQRLLLPTWNGYTLLTSEDGTFDTPQISIFNNASLTNQHIEPRMICAYCDANNILWMGTYGGGVLVSDLRQQAVHQFRQNRHNEINGITTDNKGYLWMTTYHKGLMKSKAPISSSIPDFDYLDNPVENNHTTALCIYKDTTRQEIWVGRQDGQITIQPLNGHPSRNIILLPDGKESKAAIWRILKDKKGNFWIGTDRSLLCYHPENQECHRLSVANEPSKNLVVRSLIEDYDGNIWLGTEYNGLGKVTGDRIQLGYGASYKLQNASVRSLLVTPEEELYIGSTTGLAIMNLKNETITDFFTTRNGLVNNFIGCLLQDRNGHIWVGSNSCISRYSRKQKLFYHYFLSGSNSSVYAYNQYLFWGNNRNLTYFCPEKIDHIQTDEPVAIHTLEIGNKAVEIGERINGQTILTKNLYHTRTLRLNHDNRNFSLGFNSLSYTNQYQKVRYRLYPYQHEWIVTDNQQKVSYTNLQPDTYSFQIQNMYPNEQVGPLTELEITILPHWSETWWFRLIIGAMILILIFRMVRYFKLRQARFKRVMELKHEVLAAHLERDKEKQIRMERENFFTNTAHELRTPLTLILSPLQEILGKINPQDELYQKLSLIYRNGTSLHTLVDQLLYVQKIEAGMVKLRLSKADINILAKETCQTFQELAASKEIQLTMDIPQQPYILWIDTEKIVSALRNLVSNSLKYTEKQGKVSMHIRQVEIDNTPFCRIEVTDNGVGIPEELQEHIFDSFITGPNTPQFSSKTGIGLHIVKHTMELHHGTVTFQSKPGEGSTFTLLIPEGKAHFQADKSIYLPEETPVRTSYPENQGQEYTSGKVQVAQPAAKQSLLIIEDNTDMRSFISSIFEKDFKIFEACNGEEGIQLAKEHMPALIICDLMMPVKDGISCSREIKENPQTTHIPIIILTAKAEDTDILEATQTGVDDYVMKPFNPEILATKVKNLITQRERLKRIYTKSLMLNNRSSSDETSETDTFVRQVIHVIETNLSDESFNVKKLADELHMSQPTLYRKLKQVTPLSAIDMIRSIRMSKAATLILEHNYSIQEIAEMVGYSDTRTLRKHFTEQFGTSPSQFVEKEEVRKLHKDSPVPPAS